MRVFKLYEGYKEKKLVYTMKLPDRDAAYHFFRGYIVNELKKKNMRNYKIEEDG